MSPTGLAEPAPQTAGHADGAVGTTTSGGRRGNPWLTLIAVALGVMIVALDGTVVSVANPEIQRDLGSSLSGLQWVTNAYLLALAVFLITAGKLGDRFGHKAMFFTGLVGFSVTSLLIGLAPHMDRGHALGLMILFRVLQGIFGAILQPAALGLLRNAFPPERLNMAIGIWGGAIGASTAAGPIVGGLLVQHVNWESVFYINVPVGIVALLVGLLVLARNRPVAPDARMDVPGIALLSGAMFCLVFGLVKASDWGWGAGRTWVFIAAAVVIGVGFVLVERRVREPLLPLSLFRSRNLSLGTILMIFLAFTLMGGMFFFTFYFQNAHGYSPVSTGVRLLPMTAMMIVGSPLGGVLQGKFGARPLLFGGLAMSAVAMFGLSRMELNTATWLVSLWLVLLGFGLSQVLLAATDTIVAGAPVRLSGTASGLQQAAMQVGGSLGTAVLSAVISTRVGSVLRGNLADHHIPVSEQQADQLKSAVSSGVAPVQPGMPAKLARGMTAGAHESFITGLHTSFLVAGIVVAVGALLALFVRRAQAPASSAAGSAAQEQPGPVTDPATGPVADSASPAITTAAVDNGAHLAKDVPAVHAAVRRHDGAPVSHAVLTLVNQAGRQVARNVTGADGSCQQAVPEGRYTLLVAAGEYPPQALSVLVGPQVVPVDVVLGSTGRLNGTVYSGAAPVPDVAVTLTDPQGRLVANTHTGGDGSYQMTGLAGEYVLAVHSMVHGPAAESVSVTEAQPTLRDVELPTQARLHGMVRNNASRPVPYARVVLTDTAGRTVFSTVTGDDGRYETGPLTPGTYLLNASGFPVSSTSLHLEGETGQDIHLSHETSA